MFEIAKKILRYNECVLENLGGYFRGRRVNLNSYEDTKEQIVGYEELLQLAIDKEQGQVRIDGLRGVLDLLEIAHESLRSKQILEETLTKYCSSCSFVEKEEV